MGSSDVPASAQQPQVDRRMGFFVTSRGIGDGANLGGLEGADRHCQALATAAGAGNRTWRAYLSLTATGAPAATGCNPYCTPPIHARDRIGNGPWYNARGQLIAGSVAELHGDDERDRNNMRKPATLDERGMEVPGVGDQASEHDILTGSDSHGRALIGRPEVTSCNNWTSNGAGEAMVGHHDRLGGPNTSWNAVHMTAGCSQQALRNTGGGGRLYCFAAD
jgi:hypothetical protein